jgi:simple sugar transport system ATP-binding protein
MEKVVEMQNIRKTFLHTVANNDINFDICKGEVVTLLGENGAGKTTLMKILYGMYSMDSGEIYVKGKKVDIKSPKDAISLGIGMVHQHFTLVKSFTVTENVILGLPPAKGIEIDLESAKKDLISLSKKYGLEVNPDAKIWQLSVGEKQRVEIIKALYRNIDVLIMDEPTAVLTPQEAENLFDTLRLLTKEGKSIVFISHKLGEVMEISDRIVILRNGTLAGEKNKKDTTKKELARIMVGREVLEIIEKEEMSERGEPLLVVQNLHALNDKGIEALKGISFEVRSEEILGIAGVSGNGQRELEDVLCGVRESTDGRIVFKGKEITTKKPKEIINLGIGRVPEDRMEEGLILDLPIFENLIVESYDKKPLSNGILINYSSVKDFAEKMVKEYDIKTPSIYTITRTLSGGNLQKVILARMLSRNPEFIIASQPIRGLDVGAAEYIHTKLLSARANGVGILLISEDLDEILMLSDRILVMYEGEVMGILDRKDVTIDELGLMMTGTRMGGFHEPN